jgi:hypothetical protein
MGSMMTSVVRVEHPVADYETWKREGFDHDPLHREQSGVRCYRILRASDGSDLVAIELEFDSRSGAEAFASGLREMWDQVGDRFGWREPPRARIFELAAVEKY